MPIGAAKSLTTCRRFFLDIRHTKQRIYEALRAYFLEGRPSREVARTFGYTPGSFRVLCHHFRRDPEPTFFSSSTPGRERRSRRMTARDVVVALRKRNYSVYDISDALKNQGRPLSPTAVRAILTEEGFAPLPRRLDEERPECPRPTVEPVADVRQFSLAPRKFSTRYGGLFLFVPDLVQLNLDRLADSGRLPGSKMIPSHYALRACLAMKLWSIERKSHIMASVADEGLSFFAGLNAIPKKSYFSEYSSRIDHAKTLRLLAAWHEGLTKDPLLPGRSFNLDFHSVPFHGDDPIVERHYLSMRSRRQRSVLVFLAQDADGHAFCYCNADLRKGEEADELFRFISFWERTRGERPRHLVFDSQLTTQRNLARLDEMDVSFITLRRRSPEILKEIVLLPRSAWRVVHLDNLTRKFRTLRIYERPVRMEGREFRQMYVQDLGHDEPTILLTNERRTSPKKLLTRYAQRMLIENALSDAVRFFHMDALSSTVAMKVDFDMTLLVIASGLYRRLARKMRGYANAQARQVFRDLIDIPADVVVGKREVVVRFHRRAHLPIILASGLLDQPVVVPWWEGRSLRLQTS